MVGGTDMSPTSTNNAVFTQNTGFAT